MDLLQLESCQGNEGKLSVHEHLAGVFTPLCLPQWEAMLQNHPDKEYKEYILRGVRDGFQVGFDRHACKLSSTRKNMHSAMENAQVVDDYLEVEKLRQVVLGPFSCTSCRT